MPQKKARKPPSGKPYSYELTLQRWTDLLASGLTLNQYALRHKLYRSELIISILKHFPQEWEEFKDKVGPIFAGNCAHCGRHFYRNTTSTRQKFCTSACREQAWLAVPENAEANRAKVNRWRARRRRAAAGDTDQPSA